MTVVDQVRVAPVTVARNLRLGDLGAALAAGWKDFLANPAYGLFFSAVYVLGGMLLYYGLVERGELMWLTLAAAGFPLLAPFTAVGLYEVSRRREAGLPVGWGVVLGAVRGRGDDQILMMGIVVFMSFAFWVVLARGIFAIFMGTSGIGAETLGQIATGQGAVMLLVGSAVGAMLALAFFSITVISLPMLVDRRIDFITAIITSLATVRSNTLVLLAWAVLIAVSLFTAMLPLFLGLFLVLPVLGHATWHLYRRAVSHPAP